MTSHDTKINLPTLRDADHYDDWKYKVVAFLVTLRLYQPIAEGRAPLQLQDIHDDAATPADLTQHSQYERWQHTCTRQAGNM